MEFTKKVNFKVICLNDDPYNYYYKHLGRELIVGEIYTVVIIRGEWQRMSSNNPEEWYLLEPRRFVYPENFITLAEWREKQINEILE